MTKRSILHALSTIAAAAAAVIAFTSANQAALLGQSFVDDFAQFDRTRWYISHGWANGAHQNCTWFNRNVRLESKKVELSLTDEPLLDRKFTCAEIQSTQTYGFGTYEVRMRSAAAPGIVSAFFTYAPQSTDGKGQDEVDIEFLGKDPHSVQFNFYTDGNGDHGKIVPFEFDASQATNDYAFEWLPDALRWYINGKLVHEVKAADGVKLPSRPGRIYLSIWNGIGAGMDGWLAPFKYPGKPLTASIENVSFTEAGKPCQFPGSIVCKLEKESAH